MKRLFEGDIKCNNRWKGIDHCHEEDCRRGGRGGRKYESDDCRREVEFVPVSITTQFASAKGLLPTVWPKRTLTT